MIWPHTQDQSYPKKKISSGSINSGIQSVQGRSQWYIYLYLIKHQYLCKWYTRKLVSLEIMYQLKQLDLQYVFNNRKFTMMCITSIWCGDFKSFLSRHVTLTFTFVMRRLQDSNRKQNLFSSHTAKGVNNWQKNRDPIVSVDNKTS